MSPAPSKALPGVDRDHVTKLSGSRTEGCWHRVRKKRADCHPHPGARCHHSPMEGPSEGCGQGGSALGSVPVRDAETQSGTTSPQGKQVPGDKS